MESFQTKATYRCVNDSILILVVVIAFTRQIIDKAIDKPGSENEKEIKNRRYPTVWNQLVQNKGVGSSRQGCDPAGEWGRKPSQVLSCQLSGSDT